MNIPTQHIRLVRSAEGETTHGKNSTGFKITTMLLDGIIPGWLVEGPGVARQFFPASNVQKAQLADAEPPPTPKAEEPEAITVEEPKRGKGK